MFLDAVDAYCGAIGSLTSCLGLANLHSRGLVSFRRYITNYAASDRITSLLSGKTRKLKADISSVKYTLQIRGGSITVRKYDSEINYTDDVEETFLRFQQGAMKDYRLTLKHYPQMNHVEAAVMNRVARLYAEIFANVTLFCENNSTYLDATIDRFDREVQFYVAYLDYLAPFRRTGLSFCYPDLSSESKEIYTYDAFDLALASVLKAKSTAIVCNDFYLKDNERIFIVSGPNNGGKTTFARMFGQLHYLASLGCLIPAPERATFSVRSNLDPF